jgi:hypothetical protein
MGGTPLGNGAWIETFFDPGHQNVYMITIPVLTLFALGIRKGAAMYLFVAIGFLFVSGKI